MPNPLSRTVEADLGPILAQLTPAPAPRPVEAPRRAFRPVGPPRRRSWRPATVGAYAATALVGATLGLLFAESRQPPTQGGPAQPQSQPTQPPAELQVLLTPATEPQRPALPLPDSLGVDARASAPTVSARAAPGLPPAPAQVPAPAPALAAGPVVGGAARAASRPATGRAVFAPPAAAPTRGEAPPWAPAERPRLVSPPPAVVFSPPAPRPAPPPPLARAAAPQPAAEPVCDQRCLAFRLDDAARELAAVYQDAQRLGVPARELRERGRAWEQERRGAAAISSVALLDAYEIERDELAALADAWSRGRD